MPRERIGRAAVAGVLAIGVATIAGRAGAVWWIFDLFSHFALQYGVAAAVLTLALYTLARRGWAVAAGLLSAVNLAVSTVATGASPVLAGPPPAHALRVLSFNVLDLNRQYEPLLAQVAAERPDVIYLIEITDAWMPAIDALRPIYPHVWFAEGRNRAVVLTRHRPAATEALTLDGDDGPSYLLTFEIGGRRMSVLGTHLDWPLGAEVSRLRNRQLASLARVAQQHPYPLAIVGDLNTSPFSPHFSRLLRDGRLHRCASGARWTPTWPSFFPPLFIQLDHCLVTDGLGAWEFTVGGHLGSDHLPVSVRLAPAP